jgi:hypothetical protein
MKRAYRRPRLNRLGLLRKLTQAYFPGQDF